jgi:uncharacterized small protein (DUF1192 family)
MDVTDEMLTAVVRKAVELRILPAVVFTDQYVKNWEAIRAVIQAGLVVSLEADQEIAKLRAEVERLQSDLEAARADRALALDDRDRIGRALDVARPEINRLRAVRDALLAACRGRPVEGRSIFQWLDDVWFTGSSTEDGPPPTTDELAAVLGPYFAGIRAAVAKVEGQQAPVHPEK